MREIKILETTLRDGSYTVNNQFNREETSVISSTLEEIGFEYIEIGPGIGLNAQVRTEIRPAFNDVEYIESAKRAVNKAKIGMFFIPEVGNIEDLKQARRAGLDFVRVGINITNYKKAFEYLEYANELGFITTLNLMKSYVVDAVQFAKISKECFENGASIVYLVDSAGGMLPEEVREYITEAKEAAPDIVMGFHGHNNLSLVMANTLQAIKSGAEFVDSTIRGMGRSSGNAITEKLVLLLERNGYEHHIKLEKLFELSEKIILPYTSQKHETSSDYISGFAQFHSSYLSSIKKMANKYNINKNKLIIEYSKIDKVNMQEDKLEEIAKKIKGKISNSYNNFNITSRISYKKNEEEQLKALNKKFIELKNKYDSLVYFNLTQSYEGEDKVKLSPVIHSVKDLVFGSVEFNNLNSINDNFFSKLSSVDGYLVDDRLMEGDTKAFTFEYDSNCNFYYYNDAKLMAETIYNYVKFIINLKMKNTSKICLFLDIYDEVQEILEYLFKLISVEIVNKSGQADIFIAGKNYIDQRQITKNLQWLILTVPGKLDPDIASRNRKIKLIRLDMKNEIFSKIIKFRNYEKLFKETYGMKKINGKFYCSGGYIGRIGTTVVDNIHNISRKYGFSNGDGSIDYYN